MRVGRDQAPEIFNASATIVPSPRLLRAAISGLVVASGASACDDKSSDSAKVSSQDLSNEQLSALCADMVKKAESEHGDGKAGSDAKTEDLDVTCKDKVEAAKNSCEKPDSEALCKDKVATAKNECPKPDANMLCADMVKNACAPKTPEEKTTNAEQKEYTFTQLTKMCDDRGGYVQIHAACGGQNTCKGFSYGDWGPGAATLTEHSCTGVNGCAGLSCVTLPEDKRKKTGPELYDLKFGDTDPSACSNCHADHTDENHPDLGKFTVYVMPGSTRTTANWLERSAAEQERIVAFGAHSTDAAGRAIQNMAPYKEVLSRKEIERVVAHLRTLKPVIKTIKLEDPAPKP